MSIYANVLRLVGPLAALSLIVRDARAFEVGWRCLAVPQDPWPDVPAWDVPTQLLMMWSETGELVLAS